MQPDLIRIVNQKPPRRPSRLKKFLLWALAGVALYAILGFLVLPPLVKSALVKQLTERLHRQAEIRAVKINPFLLTVTIEGFLLKERTNSAQFVSFDKLLLDLEVISLIKRGPVLREVRLIAPNLKIIRNEDFSYNFTDIIEAPALPPAQAPPPPSKPFLFSFNNIQIERGAIEFDDRPKHARHTATDMNIAVPFVSNLATYVNIYVQPAFQANINGTPVALAGKSKPFLDSRETVLDINISDFELPKYLEYVPMDLRFTMPSGKLDARLALSFIQYRDKSPAVQLRGTMAVKTLSVRELNMAPVLEFPLLAVDIDSVDVFSKKAKLRSILLQAPKLYVRRDKSGTLNFRSVLPAKTADRSESEAADIKQHPKPPPSAPLQIEVAEARVTDGEISFTDNGPEKPFRTTVQALNIVVQHFSNIRNQPTAIEASLRTDGGETLRQTGSFMLDPTSAEGSLDLQRLRIKRYAPYYRSQLLFDVEDGIVDLSTRYRYSQETEHDKGDHDTRPPRARQDGPFAQAALSDLSLVAKALRLKHREDKQEFLKVAAFSIKHTDIDLTKRTLVLGAVSTQQGNIDVRRDRDGTLNLANLVAAPQASTEQKPAARTKAQPAPTNPDAPRWVVTLKRLAVDRYAVRLEDHLSEPPREFSANLVSLVIENVSTAKNTKGKASLQVVLNKSGQLSATGSLGLDPLAAGLDLDLKNLELAPLQPYVPGTIKIAVTGGLVSAHGNLAFVKSAENISAGSFTGDVSIIKLNTIDKAHSEDFLNWQALDVKGIRAGNHPLQVEIKEITLKDFYSRLIVNADGTLNVQGLIQREAKSESGALPEALPPQKTDIPANQPSGPQEAAAEAAPAVIRIETVNLQGGNVSFSDHFIKPNYSAKLTQLAGRITGLSSEEIQKADVDVRGQLGTGAPLQIAGKINPLGKDLFVDLQVDFKDIDLSPLTPYAGRYAGYAIEKGRLSLTLKYLIDHRRLSAENKVILDEFTLGDKVDSPQATKLPVPLAVSLLKDRNGQINLDVPVTGSLDDPQFSIWGVVGMVLTNLLTKAATAPFALLGSLVGGGQELNYIEFDSGESRLGSAAQEKLQKLAKALYERPALKLEVAGHVDLMKDQVVLKRRQFERKLKAQKLSEMAKTGAPAVPLNEVKIEPNEYSKYLAMAYKKETFPKPRNFLGLPKDLPPAEMENLMLTHIEVTEDDLRQLALERAQAAKDYLLKSAKIEPGRISLNTAPTVLTEEKHSRVDFSIK
jgi:uncharacterized protein involved in outer membrane biogenesis